ncbi:MAG: F-type H+-transporting ATPase subunit a [Patescibacteria group bacterium]|nr:F-type H+-transporting ATPase subunit a [Patescibacteria group bacterium]
MSTEHVETHATAEHQGPHIPATMGSAIPGLPYPITTTVVSTWIVMFVLFSLVFVLNRALKRESSRMKTFGLDVIRRLDAFITGTIGNKKDARGYFWLLGTFFVFIFTANIVGLLLDWAILVSPKAAEYVRPVNSDLNTTLVMGLTAVVVAQATGIYRKGVKTHFGHYLANYHGDTVAERIIAVFVGWLHFVGEFVRVGSLSMRLFLNIFVGATLISVAVYVGSLIPSFGTGIFRIISMPFWFFELLVAFLQAYIFATLSGLYLREAVEEVSH